MEMGKEMKRKIRMEMQAETVVETGVIHKDGETEVGMIMEMRM